MQRKYKVRYDIAGHAKGDVVSQSDFPPGVNVPALVAGHFLTLDSVEGAPCPACVEQGNKRPAKLDSAEKIAEHYQEKHAGLVPPTEEDLASG